MTAVEITEPRSSSEDERGSVGRLTANPEVSHEGPEEIRCSQEPSEADLFAGKLSAGEALEPTSLLRPQFFADVERRYHSRLWAYVCVLVDNRWAIAVCFSDRTVDPICIDPELYRPFFSETDAVRFVDELNGDRGVTRQMRSKIVQGRVADDRAVLWLAHIHELVSGCLSAIAPTTMGAQ